MNRMSLTYSLLVKAYDKYHTSLFSKKYYTLLFLGMLCRIAGNFYYGEKAWKRDGNFCKKV